MFKQETSSRVAVFCAPGLEEIEGLTVVDLLFRAGIPCDVVAVTPERQVTSSHEVTIVCDRSIADDDFDFGAYDMLVLPGGIPGTPNLAASAAVTGAVKAMADAGKLVAAICAAPSILASLGLLEGRKATAHASFQDKLAGAEVLDQEVVVDGNITTSNGLGGAIPFGLELVRQLAGPEEAARIQKAIAYKHSLLYKSHR